MQRVVLFIFCLLIMGFMGFSIGYFSREAEVFYLKTMFSNNVPVVENQVVIEVQPCQHIQIAHQNDAVLIKDTQILAVAGPADTDHMKQTAHVPVLETETCVSTSFINAAAYTRDLEQVCDILKAINHVQKALRIQARLALAQLSIAGPLGKYVQNLSDALLVRFCEDDGALCQVDYDPVVQPDIEKALALLEQEKVHGDGFEQFARTDFSPVQRRVQRNAQNAELHTVLATISRNECGYSIANKA